ncbi:MAG TPA: hypothetical protein EYP89_03295 [Candidatus Omnitrophica bacterium]|nr:hypothetical protein [Candidatus Omnitrophota bacterium]
MRVKKAVTLIETIVSVSIILIILTATLGALYVGRRIFYSLSLKVELFQKGRIGLRSMEEEILQTRASLISIPPDGKYYNSITFQIPESIDENGNITWSSQITYFLNNDNQLIRAQDNTSRIITTNINDLKFRIDDSASTILEIYLTASGNTFFGETISVDLVTSVKLRN